MPFVGMLADEPHGLGDARVVDGGHVGRLAGRDPQRGHVGQPFRAVSTSHEAVEQGRRLVADPAQSGITLDKGRIGQLAREHLVVGTDDGHLFRHGDLGPAAGVQGLDAAEVVASHQAQGLGQALDPSGHVVDLLFPRRQPMAVRDTPSEPVLLTGVPGFSDPIGEPGQAVPTTR